MILTVYSNVYVLRCNKTLNPLYSFYLEIKYDGKD